MVMWHGLFSYRLGHLISRKIRVRKVTQVQELSSNVTFIGDTAFFHPLPHSGLPLTVNVLQNPL